MTKFAPSPRADLVRDDAAHDVGVLLVGDVESGVVQGDRSRRERGERVIPRGMSRAPADDEAAQRRAVVVALEAALHHLTEGDEREHLARRARGIRQRDVGEALDVDDLAGQQLDGRVVARDQRERIPRARAPRSGGTGSVSSPAFHGVGRSLK